jgi:ribosomal protein L6P/L9E
MHQANQCIIIRPVGAHFLKLTSANLRLLLQQWLLLLGQARILLRLVGSGAFFFELPRQNSSAIASVFMCAGTSHVFFLDFPVALVTISVVGRKKKILILTSYNLPLLQRVAFQICKLRKPDPYKGKGVKYAGEVIVRKEAKKK